MKEQDNNQNNNNEDKDKLKKSILSKTEQEILRKQKKDSEAGGIFEQRDSLTEEQLNKKNKEHEKEKIKLLGGGTTSIKEAKDFIAMHRQPYQSHFGYKKDYYKKMYELNKWPEAEYKQFVKRTEVATWTNHLIYDRFPDGVVAHIKKQNQFLFAYIRKDKYFQYLNKDGQDQLDSYIDEFITMMSGYSDWDKFEKDYCAKHGLTYQPKLF